MTGLYIASKAAIPHDGSRRLLAAGAFINGEPRIQGPAGAPERIGRALIAGRRQRQADEVLLAALREALAASACCGAPIRRGRCATCGHRVPVNGKAPVQTRYQPWRWPVEHLARWRARRAGPRPPGTPGCDLCHVERPLSGRCRGCGRTEAAPAARS